MLGAVARFADPLHATASTAAIRGELLAIFCRHINTEDIALLQYQKSCLESKKAAMTKLQRLINV